MPEKGVRAVAAVVIAGDPNVTEGMNLCEQPASCRGVGMGECAQALHGTSPKADRGRRVSRRE